MISPITQPYDLSPLYHVVGSYNCRINELEMSQNAIAPGMWSNVILREAPARVIEIGTCKGGLSSLLSFICGEVKAKFTTMDTRASLIYELAPCGQFLQWDCFQHQEEIMAWIGSPGQTILLCDGGNKMLEFNTFVRALKPGDIIAAHDCIFDDETAFDRGVVKHEKPYIGWGFNEVHLEMLNRDGLEPFQPYWTQLSGWTVWKRL